MKAKKPYRKSKRRLGRGVGSGLGKTCGRGVKGQFSRSGATQRRGFEGGQNPLYRRLPKRGFNNAAYSTRYEVVNLKSINALQDSEVTPETLLQHGIIGKLGAGVKILGVGELSKAVTVQAHRFSESAKAKIEKAGGQAVLIEK